jgi:hypothetical protein
MPRLTDNLLLREGATLGLAVILALLCMTGCTIFTVTYAPAGSKLAPGSSPEKLSEWHLGSSLGSPSHCIQTPAMPETTVSGSSGTREMGDAVRNGDLEQVRALLKDRPTLVSCRDEYGWTPLHLAAGWGKKDVAKLLLANNAEVDARDNDGKTALHLAARNGRERVVELLLANKAEADARDRDGFSPLHYAVANGCKDVAEMLRQRGAHE